MNRLFLFATLLVATLVGNAAANADAPAQQTFTNPVIPADFPDPDVAKLGDTYYFLSTTMQLSPGATVLKSNDLVHWQYCCNPLEKMSDSDKYSLVGGQHSYAQGMWAGAIEEHDGRLYILLNCNDAGAFVLSTDDPEGEWQMKRLSRSYYDPGMIMENDRIYIVCGINHINICELDTDWNLLKETTVIRKDNTGLEGSHLYHIGDYYYIYSTYGGWPTGQTIFRSRDIFGPYEEKMLMEKWINGAPNTVHQGALMQTNTGEWWTLLMEDKGAIGRLPSLHPVVWADGWPTIADNGVPRMQYKAPDVGAKYDDVQLDSDDNFRSYRLGKQWQWNHNPPAGGWSLLEHPGYLRLHTSSVTDDFMKARGTLTQRIIANKLQSSPYGLDTSNPAVATVAIDLQGMAVGDMAGLAAQQDPYALVAVTKDADGLYNLVWQSGSLTNLDDFTPKKATKKLNMPVGQTKIYLRAKFNCGNSEVSFQYSYNGERWANVGSGTALRFNLSVFVGARWALFNYATIKTGGYVDFDWFSTDPGCTEDSMKPDEFEGYGDDILTVKNLSAGDNGDNIELQVGTECDIKLIATFESGRTEDISSAAEYAADDPTLISIKNGRIKGLGEGSTTVTATYTDLLGNEISTDINVTSAYFPFNSKYIKNVWDTGTYDPETRSIRTGQYGQMGWEYSSPVDFSGYKYLVILLDNKQVCDADLRIYTQPSIWGNAYIRKLSANKKFVIQLQSITYTDGDARGQAVDLKNIYKVVFWSNGSSEIDINDMYLTNNRDYTREENTGIEDITIDNLYNNDAIYDINGRRVQNPVRGIYISNGRKFIVP